MKVNNLAMNVMSLEVAVCIGAAGWLGNGADTEAARAIYFATALLIFSMVGVAGLVVGATSKSARGA